MTTKLKDPPTESADPVAEAERVLTERQARLQELRDEVAELDEVDQEAGRAVAVAVAEGGPDVADSLSDSRRKFRERLSALHEALPIAEARVHEAEQGVERARVTVAAREYGGLRRAEEKAAEEFTRALRVAAEAHVRLHELGRAAYVAGTQAKLEGPLMYRRRLSVRALCVGTLLREVEPVEKTPNAHSVEDLADRLRAVLPPYEEGET
jgi:hypothetical protein